MKTLEAWIAGRLDTPEKARAALSTVAIALGALGFFLTLVGVFVARS